MIACAVDAATRRAVAEHIDYVRRIGDVGLMPILISQLVGPCTLPPYTLPATTDGATDGATGA